MLLGRLLQQAGLGGVPGLYAQQVVTGLTADSRAVAPGFLFAALSGANTDGRAFIPDALARGARVLLVAEGSDIEAEGIVVVRSPQPRDALSRLAAAFYEIQPKDVTAVTGTNGKTSTAAFFRQILAHVGQRAASLGTLGLIGPDFECHEQLTTPDPVTLHRLLALVVEKHCPFLCMEASSHGLDQRRLDAVSIKAAAFTNFSRDHLDYHSTKDAYFAAKVRLFEEILSPGGVAVLNADCSSFSTLKKVCMATGRRVQSYGEKGEFFRLLETQCHPDGQDVSLCIQGTMAHVRLPLIGSFQAMNVLAALGLVFGCETGVDTQVILSALETLKSVPGRLEYAGSPCSGASVYVDYAHTPDSLEKVLCALRPHVQGRLHLVFGCGGDRDPGKRPMMGSIAVKLADSVIVTDDNPRTEDPAFIRAAICSSCPGAEEIGDRRRAIECAVTALRRGDVLLIAGKGHECGQIVGHDVFPFDDRTVVREMVGHPLSSGGFS